MNPAAHTPLLQVERLVVDHAARGGASGRVVAVRDVSLTLERGSVLGLAGASGCGKSTLARALVQLVRPVSGRVLLDGADLATLAPGALRETRRRMQLLFQDPSMALSPRRTIRQTLVEPLRHFGLCPRHEESVRIEQALADVDLDPDALSRYPQQFSSGQQQRIALARALIAQPDLLIADEPVSALDVSVQARVLRLLDQARQRHGLALLLISHDLAVIRHLANNVSIMQDGTVVESGPIDAVLGDPQHVHTRELLAATPRIPV